MSDRDGDPRDDAGPDGLRYRLAAGVPEGMAEPFVAAQQLVETFFAQREEDPEAGTIAVAGERYLFMRASALSTEFVDQVMRQYADRGEREAREVAHALLFDLAHTIGKADARAFHKRMGVDEPIQRLSAGPIHFAFTGWARVEIDETSRPTPDDDFFLHYCHPNAFECDTWLAEGRASDEPVCIMNAGYSSGWCEESFGVPLTAMEYQCRTTGDTACWFIMAPPHRLQAHLDRVTGAAGATRPWSGRMIPEFFGRKRLEEELRRHRDHLEELVAERTRDLAAANRRLREESAERSQAESALRHAQKMEAVGSLAGGIAHDFNNVLTSIQMGLEFAAQEVEPGTEVHESLGDALRSAQHAATLVKRLMSVSRPQAPQHVPVVPAELIGQLTALLRRTLPKSIEIDTSCTAELDELGAVQLDGHQVEQALLNLALNAADAMADGGRLELRARYERIEQNPARPDGAHGDFVVFEVEDEGEGIPLEFQDRIFEPFFTTKRSDKGSGLGLAMVQSVLTAHEGWVELDSELGRGTEFRLYFPLQRVDPASESPPREAPAAGQGWTVLLVDDELAVLTQLSRLLRARGHQVLTASDGVHALDVLEEAADQIDVVVTDLNMPRLDGRGLMEAIAESHYAMPVVLSSGYLDDGSHGGDAVREAEALGFAAVLPKPYSADTLLHTLQGLL